MTAPKPKPAETDEPKPTKKPHVISSIRGGIDAWSCSECGWYTNADAEMAEAHIEAKH